MTERMTRSEAETFINDLCRAMQDIAWRNSENPHRGASSDNDHSIQKDRYGDTWTYLYGVQSGFYKMKEGQETGYDFDNHEKVEMGIDDSAWKEHYQKYGSGPYGRGLKVGKRVAVYTGKDFTFEEPEDDDPEFEFVDPDEDESKFTFLE